jgi:hypothetical protein
VVAEFPKPLTDEVVQAAELVITMGCGDACPIYPTAATWSRQWPPPSDNPVEDVRHIRDDIAGYGTQPRCFSIEPDAPGNSHYLKRIGQSCGFCRGS